MTIQHRDRVKTYMHSLKQLFEKIKIQITHLHTSSCVFSIYWPNSIASFDLHKKKLDKKPNLTARQSPNFLTSNRLNRWKIRLFWRILCLKSEYHFSNNSLLCAPVYSVWLVHRYCPIHSEAVLELLWSTCSKKQTRPFTLLSNLHFILFCKQLLY